MSSRRATARLVPHRAVRGGLHWGPGLGQGPRMRTRIASAVVAVGGAAVMSVGSAGPASAAPPTDTRIVGQVHITGPTTSTAKVQFTCPASGSTTLSVIVTQYEPFRAESTRLSGPFLPEQCRPGKKTNVDVELSTGSIPTPGLTAGTAQASIFLGMTNTSQEVRVR